MLGDSLKRRRGRSGASEEKPEEERPRRSTWTGSITLGRWLLVAVVVLVLSFGGGYFLSTQVLFPRPETAGAGVPVPELYGQTRDQAETAVRSLGLAIGDVREMQSMGTEAGRVLAQSPLPGQQLLPGSSVDLGVSVGPPELRVPPLIGLGEPTARDLLESVGFDVRVQQTRSMEFPAGVVTRADPVPGTARELPATVTLIVSTGPPPDSVPDSTGFPVR